MPLLFPYLLKLSCSLALVYLFYQLLLRRLTFYKANRWYLLGYSLLCFFIPFINITGVIARHQLTDSTVVRTIPVLENYAGVASEKFQNTVAVSFSVLNYCFLFFVVGVVVLLTRLLLQVLSYQHMRRNAQLLAADGVKLYRVNQDVTPFSFGNSIFINPQLHSEPELKEIVQHEFVHVRQRHTIDIICMEVLCLLNWYNPFAWLLRHAVRQNLEFIADAHVLQTGVDKSDYQYLLLKVLGVSQFSIATPFNFSSLKKRIVMMNKMKSAKAHLVKFLFMLPLLAVLLVAFRSEQVRKQEAQHLNKLNTTDTLPVPPPPPLVPDVTAPDAAAQPNDYTASIKDHPTVSKIRWTEHTLIVELKSGKQEVYQRHDAKSMAAARKKYGDLIMPPPPPPAPPMIAPHAITDTAGAGTNNLSDLYQQQLELLNAQAGRLNDSMLNYMHKENIQALQSFLKEQEAALQKKQIALNAYLQQQQYTASATKFKAAQKALQQRQNTLNAEQEYLQKMQEQLQSMQKDVNK